METAKNRFVLHPAVRIVGIVLAIALCVWTIKGAATIGLSRLFVRYAIGMGNLAAGKQAVQLSPMDPESHWVSAELLGRAGQPAESIVEVEKAVALRPSDYSLWLSLGMVRDQHGDTAGALAAFEEAVKRAPFYAQPRWQRGNALLRTGQYEAAFKDLNQAARSEPELIPNLIDLAWGISKGDPGLTEQLAVDTDRRRIAFARLLVRHGKATEALGQFKAMRLVSGEFRQELVGQLLARDAFKEAYEVWKSDQPGTTESLIDDGGFEAPLTFDQGGFGWRVTRTMTGVSLAVDSSKTHTGSKSLRLEFTGDSTAELPAVSQLILVEPSRRYRINFAARSENVVSGGLPIVAIRDAAGTKSLLGHSTPLTKGTRDWEVGSFEFDVPAQSTAIFVSVLRQNCPAAPCPAFGAIWLDSFSIERVK